MDWHLLALSFITVFLSELGDKSQIAAVALGGTSRFPLAVFLGTAGALVFTSFLGVVIGQSTAELLPSYGVKLAAAIGFMVLGLRLFFNPDSAEGESLPEQYEGVDPPSH